MRSGLRLLAVFALLLSAGSCEDKVAKPTSDSTPPTITWAITNQDTGEQKTFPNSGSLNVSVGSRFYLTMRVNDPQGVHQTTLGDSSGYQCVGDGVASNVGPGLGVTETNNLQPDSNGLVLTSTFLFRNVQLVDFPCPSGQTFSGGSQTFQGTATNYFNGKTQGTFTFHIG